MNNEEYLKAMSEEFNKIQQERFLSYGEIFDSLGFKSPDGVPNGNYIKGWYKGEEMSWDAYLHKRYMEDHPEDPNIEIHDRFKIFGI